MEQNYTCLFTYSYRHTIKSNQVSTYLASSALSVMMQLSYCTDCSAGQRAQATPLTRPPGLLRLFLLRNTHNTSNGLSKHSTPTSEHFERGATPPPSVLGSLYGHHHDLVHHAGYVWSWPCQPAVKYQSANQAGRTRQIKKEPLLMLKEDLMVLACYILQLHN